MLLWDVRQCEAGPAVAIRAAIASQERGGGDPGMLTSISSLPAAPLAADATGLQHGSSFIFGGFEDGTVRSYDIRSPNRCGN